MRFNTIENKDFSFFTGWPKNRINTHITIELSWHNDTIKIKNLSNAESIIQNEENYDIIIGGTIKRFITRTSKNTIEIRTPFAPLPFFVRTTKDDRTIITNSYTIHAQYGDTSKLNKQYCALRMLGEVAGLHLPFLDSKYLFPSFIYEYTAKGLKAKNTIFNFDETNSSMENTFEQVDALYAEYCSKKSHVIASLTGGFDSRFYSSMLRRHLKKDQLDFFYVGNYEAHLCSWIAKALDANLTLFDVKSMYNDLRQKPLDTLYGGEKFHQCAHGLWREEGLYLFNATSAVAQELLGEIKDDTGFMGMCIESANKGTGYQDGPNLTKMLDRMYVERHPDLTKFRAANTQQSLETISLEETYKDEFDIIKNLTDRPDILVDLYTYYTITFPKTVLRNSVYATSGRIYYPLMDERFFNAYLGVPAADKIDTGLYKYGFSKINPKLLSLPHQSMDTLKAGLKISSAGHYLQKINHKARLKLGLAKKYKGPKRNWLNEKTAEILGPVTEQHYKNMLPELAPTARKFMYPYEIYLLGEYINYAQKETQTLK